MENLKILFVFFGFSVLKLVVNQMDRDENGILFELNEFLIEFGQIR